MKIKIMQLNLLATSILLAQQSFALEALSDHSLRDISGQDGITLQVETDKVTVDQVNWKDNTQLTDGSSNTLNLSLNKIVSTPWNASKLGGTVKIDVGSDATNKAGIRLETVLTPASMNIGSIAVCTNASKGANCTGNDSLTLGSLTFQNRAPLKFVLETKEGLFNKNSPAYLEFGLQNANLFHTVLNDAKYNQLIVKDFNFNFKGTGYLYVDATKGIMLSTNASGASTGSNFVTLSDVNDLDYAGKTKPGFSMDLRYKANVGADSKVYSAAGSDPNLKGFGRIGASGKLYNAQVQINADRTNLGSASSRGAGGSTTAGTGDLTGNTGLHANIKTDFARDDVVGATGQKTYFDLGMTGPQGYVLRYGNLTPLQIRKDTVTNPTQLNTDLSSINFGDIYINVAKTNTLNFALSQNLANIIGQNVATPYKTILHYKDSYNPNALAIAVRGMEFQAIARSGRFVADNSITNPPVVADSTWGLGLPIYNLNANLGIYGTTYGVQNNQGIGFGLTMSTEGRNATGSKTTSILLIDGAKNPNAGVTESVNYYAGLRNLDLLVDATGVLGLEADGIYLDLPKLVLAAGGEIAIGQLPGSRYVTATCATSTQSNCFVPSNSFTTNTDVLFGFATRIDGTGSLRIIPGSATDNSLGITGNMYLYGGTPGTKGRSFIQIIDKADNSTLGIDNISGQVGLDAKVKMNQDTVTLGANVNLNPYKATDWVLRADANLYPKGSTTPQKLGDVVFTGGNIRSTFGITPR